mgnify:CR=1 FL=1
MADSNLTTEVFGDVGQLVSDVDMLDKVEPKTIQHKTGMDDGEGEEIIVLELHTKSGKNPTTYEHFGGPQKLEEGLREWAESNGLSYASRKCGEHLIVRDADLEGGHSCAQYSQNNPRIQNDNMAVSETKCSICRDWCVREYELQDVHTSRVREWGL